MLCLLNAPVTPPLLASVHPVSFTQHPADWRSTHNTSFMSPGQQTQSNIYVDTSKMGPRERMVRMRNDTEHVAWGSGTVSGTEVSLPVYAWRGGSGLHGSCLGQRLEVVGNLATQAPSGCQGVPSPRHTGLSGHVASIHDTAW